MFTSVLKNRKTKSNTELDYTQSTFEELDSSLQGYNENNITRITYHMKHIMLIAIVCFSIGLFIGSYSTGHQEYSKVVENSVLKYIDADNSSSTISIDNNIVKNNNRDLPEATECTVEQRKKITFQLVFKEDNVFDSTKKEDYGRFSVPFTWFSCPEASWIETFYKEQAYIGSKSFLGLSVGCNKGFDAIYTARMGLSNKAFDIIDWKNTAIFDDSKGVCRQDKKIQQEIVFPKRTGEMHCIEPMPGTYAVLKQASENLKLGDQGFIVSHAAISTVDGIAKFPNGRGGTENQAIHTCSRANINCMDVPMYSLDSYVEKHVKSSGPINILQIDVEGWDFNVLFGASSVLDRTHYLEFEYHNVGNWNKLHLSDAIRLLDGKGFTCYWAGVNRVWRITQCYFEVYNYWHGWSNIACVHRSQEILAHKMEKLFLDTLASW